MGKVIIPVNYPKSKNPVIFLAGPVLGAEYWHSQAIKIIKSLDSKIDIASPSIEIERKYQLQNPYSVEDTPSENGSWPEVDWQNHYLEKAFEKGCILFYMGLEVKHYCNHPFGQDSRFESGEYFGRLLERTRAKRKNKGNIVIGFDTGFPGEAFMRYKILSFCPHVPISFSLEKTCRRAVQLANRRDISIF